MAMFTEFRDFLLRGNVVDLAVAVVVGAAFGAVVTSLVEDLLTPLIAAVGGQPDFSALTFTINGSRFRYGEFINAIVSLLIVGAAVFFLVIKPVNTLMARRKAGEVPEPEAVPEDVVILGEIRDLLKAR
jgi:large conductance mechanosensitive channel